MLRWKLHQFPLFGGYIIRERINNGEESTKEKDETRFMGLFVNLN